VKLALIKENKTHKNGLNDIDDIVGFFEDDHVFTSKEIDLFNIIIIPGAREDMKKEIPQIIKIKESEEAEEIRVWENPKDKKLRKIEKMPKYILKYNGKTQKVEENFSKYLENNKVKIAHTIIK